MGSLLRSFVNRYLARRDKVSITNRELKDLRETASNARAELAEQGNSTSLDMGLERLRRRNIPIGSIFDVGASDGQAVSSLLPYYRQSQFYCIEAEPRHEKALARLAEKLPQLRYKIAAAGNAPGEIFFNASEGDLYSGKASATAGQGARRCPMVTLDGEAGEHRLPGPYLIKLDTHGFEIPVLEGARKVLLQTEVLIIEGYNIRFDPACPLFFELCQYLAERGFSCADILEPKYRPSDLMLWQMDLLFLKSSRKEFSNPHPE
jgi:FkbM family methyltransferase